MGVTQTVGQYELIRRIGSGGMADVWVGRRASVGGATKSVAIKLMAPRVAQDERHRRMFLAEARLSMLMTHSNVVQVFDAGEDEGRLFLVMEWIDGLNLAQLCELQRREGKPWPPRLVGYVIGEVLRGLAYAHHLTHEGQTQCVVHRDISPHNVLVSTSGEVKIADFGVARLSSEETSGLHIKGKLRYMAPEHLAGRSREPSVDLYGVGAVLHELLTGSRFREEADEVDLYGQILGGHLPPLGVTGIPLELASLREGLLQPEARQRIPTAARALEYLSAWAGYRNAAAELGTLCRGAMGVMAPRSGVDSGPTQRSVDVGADTEAASVATRTSGRAAAGSGIVRAASTRTSGAMGAADTRTSGAVARAVPASAVETEAMAAPPPPRPKGRRAALIAVGVLGMGFVAGGIGVGLTLRGRGRDGEAEPDEGGGDGAPSPEPVAIDDGLAGPAAVEPSASSTSGAATVGQGDTSVPEPDTVGTAGGTTAEISDGDGSSGGDGTDGRAPTEPTSSSPRRPPKKATVKFGLRSPVRVAYVRVGRSKGFAVDPVAERSVPAGRQSIWWRATPDGPWVDGGRFTFDAGRRYQLRLTKSGPVLE